MNCCSKLIAARFGCGSRWISSACCEPRYGAESCSCRKSRSFKDASPSHRQRNGNRNWRNGRHAGSSRPGAGQMDRAPGQEGVHRGRRVRSNRSDDLRLRLRRRTADTKRLGGQIRCIRDKSKGLLLRLRIASGISEVGCPFVCLQFHVAAMPRRQLGVGIDIYLRVVDGRRRFSEADRDQL
jgi:hypothetical protein